MCNSQTIKLLEENTEVNLYDFRFDNLFLDDIKTQTTKASIRNGRMPSTFEEQEHSL